MPIINDDFIKFSGGKKERDKTFHLGPCQQNQGTVC